MARTVLHIGDTVTHSMLGEGVVTIVDKEYITIRFAEIERTFRFPDAFLKGFLKSESLTESFGEGDETLETLRTIANDLRTAKMTFEQVRDEENQDYDALPYERKDGEEGEQIQEYIEAIENAIDGLDEALENLGEAMEHIENADEEEDLLMKSK